jgi:Flp pilus assembly protein TadD
MAASKLLRACCHPCLAATLLVLSLAGSGQAIAAGSDDDDKAAQSEYSLAKQAIKDGDYDVAINKLARLQEEDPNDADVLNLLGYGYRKTGNHDQARGYYLQALAIEPKHRGANEYLGELYLETEQLNKAEKRLAVLDSACWLGCEEFTDLKESIDKYKTAKGIQ